MECTATDLPGRLAFALALAIICLPFLAWAGEVEIAVPSHAIDAVRHEAPACSQLRPETRPAVLDSIGGRDG